MGLFSKELAQLDKNTTLYMIDDMQETIKQKDTLLAEKDAVIADREARIAALEKQLAERK